MSTIGRVLSMRVRARNWADHAFNLSGIVEWSNPALARLGEDVPEYDVRTALYPVLGDTEEVNGNDTGRLLYDSEAIRRAIMPHSLCSLSNGILAAELDQHLTRRQREYLSRYAQVPEIMAAIQQTYPAKLTTLQHLASAIDAHFAALDAAYGAGGVTSPKVIMATRLAGMGSAQESSSTTYEGANEKQKHSQTSRSWLVKWDTAAGTWIDVKEPGAVALSQETVSVSENDEFRHPKLENDIRHARASTDIMDEILAERLFNLRVPHLEKVWAAELRELDLEVRRLQLQYIETFLIPRVAGRVTSVMKAPGDGVRAGEPVIRIESDDPIELTGHIRSVSRVYVGQGVTIETDNAFESAPPVPVRLTGTVVSVRGYDAERDRWTIVVECMNSGAVRLPLGYDFEPAAASTRIVLL